MKKGMLVFVLRSADGSDCTNGGFSSRWSKFVLIGRGVPEIFEPSEDSPPLYLSKWCGVDVACPEDLEAAYPRKPRPGVIAASDMIGKSTISHLAGWMVGGNYVNTCDSRMTELLGHSYPIPIYDRRES